MKKTALLLALALPLLVAGQQRDWANYGRYAEANAALTTAPAVVFMGNSITDGWDNAHPEFFTDNNFACRGIGGQVTSQMLCRFRADVIALRPKAVVILAGTNDIAGNNGPIECEHIVENIVSMAELALAAVRILDRPGPVRLLHHFTAVLILKGRGTVRAELYVHAIGLGRLDQRGLLLRRISAVQLRTAVAGQNGTEIKLSGIPAGIFRFLLP